MNRKELMDRALKETGTLSEAMALVKTFEEFMEDDPSEVQAVVTMRMPEPYFPLEVQTCLPMGPPPEYKPEAPTKRRKWKPTEIAAAEAIMNNGGGFEEIESALGRKYSSVCHALRKRIIVPQPGKDPRDPKLRARSFAGAITLGKKVDYDEAEKFI